MPFLVRPLAHADLAFVLAQHHTHFPDNVLGRLGDGFLRRYYGTFIESPHAAALVATRNGSPIGYLVGIEDTRAHRAWLRRHRAPGLMIALIWSFSGRPRLAIQLWRARRARRRLPSTASSAASAVGQADPVAVLSHLAVQSQHHGGGVGHQLVAIFVDGATAAGAARIAVATADDNVAAARLYERHGWRVESRRTMFDGRTIRIYDKPLTEHTN